MFRHTNTWPNFSPKKKKSCSHWVVVVAFNVFQFLGGVIKTDFFSVQMQVAHFSGVFWHLLFHKAGNFWLKNKQKKNSSKANCPSQTYCPSAKIFISCLCYCGAERTVLKKDMVQLLPDWFTVCRRADHLNAHTFIPEDSKWSVWGSDGRSKLKLWPNLKLKLVERKQKGSWVLFLLLVQHD